MTAAADGSGAASAAKQLEAFFLRQLLAESRPQGGGVDGGFASDTFKSMLDEAIADKMSNAGGIGLATIFEKQLGGEQAGIASGPPGGSFRDFLERPAGLTHGAPAGLPTLATPVQGRLGSGYGMRTDSTHETPYLHKGVDLAAPIGTPVVAAAPGTVTRAERAGTYGNLVTVRHANGFETRYAHLSAIDVTEGQQIQAGQAVGKVGSTGNSALPHLHFEVRHGEQAIDPAQVLAPGALHRHPGRPNR